MKSRKPHELLLRARVGEQVEVGVLIPGLPDEPLVFEVTSHAPAKQLVFGMLRYCGVLVGHYVAKCDGEKVLWHEATR